jgi:cobalt-zinc-cadmium efflux system outer membrane protein
MNRRILLAASLALPGCVHYSAQPLNPAGSAAALSDRSLAAKTWTLRALVAEAARLHPDVALARAQYDTARAAVVTAGERPNPTIALAPQIVTPYVAWQAGTYSVDFDWTFETAGKRSRRLDAARAGVNAAAAHVIDVEWKSRVAVRKALLELYAAEQRGKLIGDAVAKQDELLKLLDDRIKAGAEARTALAQPRLLQAQLRLQAADASKAAALARASLAEALGMGTSGLAGAKFSFAPFEGVPGKRIAHRRAALTHRADVIEALANYAAAESTLRLEIAKQYPDIHLNPGYSFDQNENKWTLGLGLTLPILNHNLGPIGEADGKRKEAQAKFNVVQAKVLADCDRAAVAVAAARAKIATTDEMIAEQDKQLASEQRMVAAGEGDKLALLSAQVERATTLTARLDALVELQAALGALEEATQSPLEK